MVGDTINREERMSNHPTLRPSSLPILKESPKFVSSGSDFADEGTDRHQALRDHFAGYDGMLNLLDEDGQEAVRWAADYIRLKANMADHAIEWETERVIDFGEFESMTGHLDAVCGLDIFDLKWRERDYSAQMACYALSVLQDHPDGTVCRTHLLFGANRKAVVLEWTQYSARAIIDAIIEDVRGAEECRPSSYCGWCAITSSCPVLTRRAQAVADGREDWKLEQYHASAIEQPSEMAKALTLARHIKRWVEGVEHHAKEMAIKQGRTIPGYELREKSGKRICTDVNGAFNASGLPAHEFLACCSLRFVASKKDPSQKGLENVYKETTSLPSLAAAKRELRAKLEPYTTTAASSISLVSISLSEETEPTE